MKTKLAVLCLLLATAGCSPTVLPIHPTPASPMPVTPKPVFRVTTNTPVYFECRGNEVFFIDADDLKAKAAQAKASIGTGLANPEKLMQQTFGNDIYRIDPGLLALGIMGLKPNTGVRGETIAELSTPDSKFKATLSKLNPAENYIVLFIRPDSVAAYRKVRRIAETAGLKTSFELLESDEPISFESLGR